MQRTDSQGSAAGEDGESEQQERAAGGVSGKEWAPGEPIRFGGGKESRAEERLVNAVEQETQRSSSTSLFRPSTVTAATRGSSPSSRAHASPSSSTQSWPLSHRWDPPSPAPSTSSALSRNSSTARFSLSRSYAGGPSATEEATPSKTPSGGPSLSQFELDELVAGVDFEDTSELIDEADVVPATLSSQTPGRAAQLAPEELNDLLEGVDFSQGFGLSDEELEASESFESDEIFFTAAPSPRASTPATPPPSAPSARLIVRNSPTTLPPSRPVRPDVFSPGSSSPPRAPVTGSPLRATTSAGALLSSALPTSPASSVPARPYSTEAKGEAKAKIVIDLSDSPSSPPRAAPSHSSAASIPADPDRSDDSVVLLAPRRRLPTQPLTQPDQSSQADGWFVRPASLASKPHPASAASSLFTSAATNPSSATSSFKYPRRSPSPSASLHPMPNFPSARPPRPGSKRAKAEERQAELRQKWPREFSYRTFGRGGAGVKLVVSTDEGEIETVLRSMEGPLGFDLEWNPYVRGKNGQVTQGKTALVQVCDASTVLLVQVSRMPRFPPALKAVIEDPQRIKLGVQIAGDATKLSRDFGHCPSGTLELNALVRTYDAERLVGRTKPGLIGLQELTGIYLDRYLPKEADVRCGKWTAKLSEEQIEYAANDVYASLNVLLAIQALSNKDITHEDLSQLASRPYNSFYGFSRSPAPPTSTAAVAGLKASTDTQARSATSTEAPSSLSDVLAPRKLEAFQLFHLERLSVTDISTRMSQTLPIKPSSVLWSLLGSFEALKQSGLEVEWDFVRLVEAADEVQWSPRMTAEHGALINELRSRVA
ncbi:hypothetical protein JCM6882_004239 [Rhodosporidiobolus microsporus]